MVAGGLSAVGGGLSAVGGLIQVAAAVAIRTTGHRTVRVVGIIPLMRKLQVPMRHPMKTNVSMKQVVLASLR